MQQLMAFEEHEVLELNGRIMFNPYHVGECLELGESAVKMAISKMNEKQVVKLTNSIVKDIDFRKLHNTGENFLTESGVYKLVFRSNKPNAEKFTDWIADEVLPALRKTGSYEMPRQKEKIRPEHLASVNNAVKILAPMLEAAGCSPEIQLLTAKSLYEKAGVSLPVEIHADKHYVDTVHITRHVGLYYRSSGKPADKAVNEIIRRLDIPETMYTETWESKGKWQGAVRKYDDAVIGMVKQWYADNGYPREIEYTQCDGQKKAYHVMWRDAEVA